MIPKPRFFDSQSKFRTWLQKFHLKRTELWVGYHKKATGRKSITWPESVDEGLCFGWIDGIRKSLNEESYTIRFTPRRKNSNWSSVNIKRIQELIELGLVSPAGLEAFSRRTEQTSEQYAYEQGRVKLSEEYVAIFKQNPKAWQFFETLAASYKRPSIWWVMSAKRPETRARRLDSLISCCERNEKIPRLINKPSLRKKK